MPKSTSPATPRPLPTGTLRAMLIGIVLLGAVDAPPLEAQGQGARRSQQHRPAQRPSHQARPVQGPRYLQPSLSGIRPPGFGKFTPSTTPTRHLHAPVVHHPQVVYVPLSTYTTPFVQTPQPQQPVIVVQAPPPQPAPQPVVVQVAPPPAPTPPVVVERPAPPARPPEPREPGQIRFTVVPSDAVVYLNDDRVGTADELENAAPLVVDAGVHVLEISHPDWSAERLVFGVPSAGDLRVQVDLRETKASRRTRLREGNS